MSETPQVLSIKPVRHWGGSFVVTLVREVRQALKIKAGDQVVFRQVGRYVFVVKVNGSLLAPVTKEEMQMARAALEG
jgi:antitoxin component of MazEF toxin-antitoxin module